MSVVRTVGTGVAWNLIGTFADKILFFANIFIIFRSLTVYQYGLTELSLSVFSIGSILLMPGIVSTIIADLSVERARGNLSRMKAIFWSYATFAGIAGFCGWAVLFFGSSVVAHYTGNDLIDSYLKIVSFLFLTAPLRVISSGLTVVFARFADQALYSIVEEVAKFCLLLLCFFVLDLDASGLLYAVVLSQVAVVIIFLPRTLSAYRVFGSAHIVDPEPFWKLFHGHRKWSLGASFVSSMGQNAYLWLIKVILGTEAVGLYSAASGLLSNLIGLLPMGPVLTSLVPQYIERPADLVRLVKSSIKLQCAIALALMACGYMFGWLFGVIFPKYVMALPLFYILLVSIIPNALLNTTSPVFTAFKEQRSLLTSVIFKFALAFVLAPPLMLVFGIYGIGVEMILRNTISAGERSWRLRKFLPMFHMSPGEIFVPDELEWDLARTLRKQVQNRFLSIFRRS